MGKAENVLASAGRFEVTMAVLCAASFVAVAYSQHRQKPPEQRQRSRTVIIAAWVLLAVVVACAVWLYKDKDAAMTSGAFSGGGWWASLLSD